MYENGKKNVGITHMLMNKTKIFYETGCIILDDGPWLKLCLYGEIV